MNTDESNSVIIEQHSEDFYSSPFNDKKSALKMNDLASELIYDNSGLEEHQKKMNERIKKKEEREMKKDSIFKKQTPEKIIR